MSLVDDINALLRERDEWRKAAERLLGEKREAQTELAEARQHHEATVADLHAQFGEQAEEHADLLYKYAAMQRIVDAAPDAYQRDPLAALQELLTAPGRMVTITCVPYDASEVLAEDVTEEPPTGSVVLDVSGDAWQSHGEDKWRPSTVQAHQGVTFKWEHVRQYAPLHLLHVAND
ncbi:MAG: hypothetical protein AVDCRST_MAG91-3684 [uncultured Sphingomonadaceae bacterium]|uniref:Uncharacterized protein n=1 Tax=uncultured Sphingomonadaceae bacterium TaxID=169976 RepID=A0A6J4U2Y4_9SPHN|nr:MAG: hypothetical protein AVDCRST_MAG91-3684 [uncultured Sphingomonadaceae bacterium]